MPGYQPSGDLLAMMGKGAAGLGGLGPGFGGQAGGLNQQVQQLSFYWRLSESCLIARALAKVVPGALARCLWN